MSAEEAAFSVVIPWPMFSKYILNVARGKWDVQAASAEYGKPAFLRFVRVIWGLKYKSFGMLSCRFVRC